jgi:hypothetical protein
VMSYFSINQNGIRRLKDKKLSARYFQIRTRAKDFDLSVEVL